MRKYSLNRDWRFMPQEPSIIPGADSAMRTVHLPHDFMIEAEVCADAPGGSGVGFYPGGVGTYTKHLYLKQEELSERMLLEFEGCFGWTKVFINGSLAGSHHYGYTPFLVNIRPYVKPGINRIQVIVHNDAQPNSRWYSGAGLYRGVNLLRSGSVYIAPDGLFVKTEHLAENDAFLKSEIRICGKSGKDGCFLDCVVKEKSGGKIVARREQKVWPAGEEGTLVRQKFFIEEAKLWSTDTPFLYEICMQLYDGEKRENILDEAVATFGVRTITVDVKHGFRLNGESMKLKGGCIHHDNGILGAASYYDALYRKVFLHKKNGYNALRLVHNPHSSALLDICDELGMIVMDEAFDTWRMEKSTFDFSQFFDEEWEQEMKTFLLRDRNHPSVCFWSIGNELTEQGGMAEGYEMSAKLTDFVRSYDDTRPILGALCSFFKGLSDEDTEIFWKTFQNEAAAGKEFLNMDNAYGKKIWPDYTAPFAANWDVAGYNYLCYQYESSHKQFPDRVICATESKPKEAEVYWDYVEKLPYVIGDFLWSSQDYIGEAGLGKRMYVEKSQESLYRQMIHYTSYPYRLANTGDFDICGNVKPQGVYHRIIWGSDETWIFTHNPANYNKAEILGRYGWSDGGHCWTYPVEPGSPVIVEVYSAAHEVELFVNGRSLGRRTAGKEHHYRAVFETVYEPGRLEAISYKDGKKVSSDQVATVGKAVGIRICMEKEILEADGESLAYGTVKIVDKEGNYVPTATNVLAKAYVSGAAVLAGFGSGRGETEENYTSGTFTSYEGRWQIIVRSGYEEGVADIGIVTEEYGSAEMKILIKKREGAHEGSGWKSRS